MTEKRIASRQRSGDGVWMRVTVDLDPDLAAELQEAASQKRQELHETLREALRTGFAALTQSAPAGAAYEVQPQPLGLRAGLSYDRIGELLQAVESPVHQ